MKALKLTILGKVQGVGYRRWFAQHAVALGLKGYVLNLDSGAVEALLLGDDGNVIEQVNRAKVGPTHAAVTDVVIVELASEQQRFTDFQIRRE
ncbi:acylphosphatase [Acinetobacter sp. WCHA55]|uniref:acylphosphatase n=1 Tax=Acinetobacter sp. WCHA55 TaxID=2004646 RepID=UPI000B3BDF96|nr:acylphosphatase [Acinetobacter sp. WCHA55]AYA68543.1 acylphosphatase [Acinetobacter sp. WCHA55]